MPITMLPGSPLDGNVFLRPSPARTPLLDLVPNDFVKRSRKKKKQNRIATFADEILSLVIITRIRQLLLNRQIKENNCKLT